MRLLCSPAVATRPVTGRFARATAGPVVARVDRPGVAHATVARGGRSHGRFARDALVTRLLRSRRGGVGVQSNGVGVHLVATSVMSSSSVMSDHNDSTFVTSYPPLLRMPYKCINKCGKHVSQAGNTCGTCMKATKAAMMASGTENCNISIVNRPSRYNCGINCGTRVAYNGDVCLTCAEAQ